MAVREGIREMAKRAQGLAKRVRNMKDDAEEKMEVAMSAVATVGTAGGLAVLRARLNDPATDEDPLALGGVPMDLVGGIVMHGISAFGGFGKYSAVGAAIGNGMLSSWAVVKGLELGEEMRIEAAKTGTRGVMTQGAAVPPLPHPGVAMPRASTMQQPQHVQG